MTGQQVVALAKVNLNDLFFAQTGDPRRNRAANNRIDRKHVDFLLCEPTSLQPVFGVELVKPVGKSETREADQFMEDLFLSAGLPLVHIPSSERYQQRDVAELFQLAVMKVREDRKSTRLNSSHRT